MLLPQITAAARFKTLADQRFASLRRYGLKARIAKTTVFVNPRESGVSQLIQLPMGIGITIGAKRLRSEFGGNALEQAKKLVRQEARAAFEQTLEEVSEATPHAAMNEGDWPRILSIGAGPHVIVRFDHGEGQFLTSQPGQLERRVLEAQKNARETIEQAMQKIKNSKENKEAKQHYEQARVQLRSLESEVETILKGLAQQHGLRAALRIEQGRRVHFHVDFYTPFADRIKKEHSGLAAQIRELTRQVRR